MKVTKTSGFDMISLSFGWWVELPEVEKFASALYKKLMREAKKVDMPTEIVIGVSDRSQLTGYYSAVREGKNGRPRKVYVEDVKGANEMDARNPHIHVLVHSGRHWYWSNMILRYARSRYPGGTTDCTDITLRIQERIDYVRRQSRSIRTIRIGDMAELPYEERFIGWGRRT